jgi:predicted TIM-barrel fold metal-dependent hydrolase
MRGESFWVAMELGERELSLKYAIDAIGSEKILYASDYPHEPTNEAIKSELEEFLESNQHTQQVKKNLLYTNTKRFCGLN